ncbi:hypothetical protein Tco_0767581, partial [Tanacetum coccineum]
MRHSMRMLAKDTRSQDGIDDKDNDKGSKSRSQSMKEQAYNKEQIERPRPHELNDKSNLIDLMKELTTLAEHIIVAGSENRPPMLKKSMYESWASCIRLFIKGKNHGRMMLDSIENGSLVYPTVEEDGQTRPKKYSELTEAQQLQDDCDVQATNIILHGLPRDVYALVNHQKKGKDSRVYLRLLVKKVPLSLDYVPGPEYLEYLAPSDEEVPVEDQPNAVADSPIALSSGYIDDSDPEVDPKDESEDGLTYYPADGGDDNDDDSSGDDADDEDEEEASEEDKDEDHLALLSSVTPPPPPAYRTTARMSIRAQTPIPFLSKAEVDRLLAIPTPPPSQLTPLSSPLPQIPSPPFLVPSPPTTSPTYTEAPLGYRAARIWLRTASPPPLPLSSPLPLPLPIILPRTIASMVLIRAAVPSTYILTPRSRLPLSGTPLILPIPLPTSSLPLPLPSTDRRADVPKAVLLPKKRLCIAPGPRFEVGESSSVAAARSTGGFRADYGFVGTLDAEIRRGSDREVGYRITDVWVDPAKAAEEIPPTTLAELSQRVTNFVTSVNFR